MEKSIVNELVSQIHQLGKEDIPKDELLNILKSYVEKERKLMENVFTDGNKSYNGAYFNYYYDLKFGNKSLQLLPDLHEAVFVKVKDRNGNITQYFGSFRESKKGLYFDRGLDLDTLFNINNIIEWNYADERFVSNFNTLLKGLKFFNFDDYNLNKRFINIYKKYNDVDLTINIEDTFYMTDRVKVESRLDAFKYLNETYKKANLSPKKQIKNLYYDRIWMYDGILSEPDEGWGNLVRIFGRRTDFDIAEKITQKNYVTEEDVIKLEENFDNYYNKSHVNIFKIK